MRYGLMFGAGVLFVVALPFLGLALRAVMDALVRPDSHWTAADQNKTAWVLGLLAGPVVLFPVGIMVSLGYTPTVRVPQGRQRRQALRLPLPVARRQRHRGY